MPQSAVRIAITGANQEIKGGAETYLAWLLKNLVARGHDVAFGFERSAEDPEQAVDRNLEPLTRWHIGGMSRGDFFEQLTAFRPDVVFLQAASDETLDLAIAQRFRAVLFAHAFYGTCATGWKVHRFPTLRICKRRFGLACLAVNYTHGCGGRNPLQLLHVYSSQQSRSKVLRGLVGLVVASEYMRDVYVQNGMDVRHVRVLPPPVNLEPDPAPTSICESPRRILFLGRFTSGKGAARAILAVARCQRTMRDRKLHLTMAGEGPELPRCRRLALSLGVPTEFPGWVGAEQRLELLRNADVLIVPSLWPEPFGMVGIEAASFGVPAVAFKAGGIVDWLRPGENGELAEGFRAEALARALQRAVGDPRHHHRLRLGAWQTAREFSGQKHVAGLEAFFRELCGQSSR